ncbi:2Fe-2S iron-sulfur cluster-binding protein [Massilia sp. CF038]|uniref:2Fe-2S iron-sulfur cluster-binding protein n=1 Tax=Massilia sp. CF038 TaxID=1881045 RepID=UPI00091907D4|nr:2Fe-2S iron-sulfur cluster-binding protein [Massilia sp. CF038]SHH04403.1 Ferredoxin [Massilia sp. CF038]
MQVQLQPMGWVVDNADGLSVLAAAEAAGITLPSSCRNGTCRTCICQMTAGAVRYLVEWPGVSADEKAAGWILPCVAVPLGDLQLQVPAARRPSRSD